MADALGSGPSDRKVVRVQLPLPAPLFSTDTHMHVRALYPKALRQAPVGCAVYNHIGCASAKGTYNASAMTRNHWFIIPVLVPMLVLFGAIRNMFPATGATVSKVVVDKSFHVTVLNSGSTIYAFPNATGTTGDSATPTGSYTVTTKQADPNWRWEGKVYAPYVEDKENGLGVRWIGISLPTYGLHGTNEPFSIGKDISHGCVRHLNADVIRIFPLIASGTTVHVIETPVSVQTETMVTDFLELYDLCSVLKGPV